MRFFIIETGMENDIGGVLSPFEDDVSRHPENSHILEMT